MVDTSILIAGSGWPRWSYEVLLAASQGEFRLVLSPYILDEARRILNKRFSRNVERFEQMLSEIEIEVVADPTTVEIEANQDLMRDPADIPIALAAIKAGVDYFVSEDKDFTAKDRTTIRLHERLYVCLAGSFLREALGWSSEQLEAVRHRTWQEI